MMYDLTPMNKVHQNSKVYKILYLTPDTMLEKSRFLKLQRKYIKTYIEELVLGSTRS